MMFPSVFCVSRQSYSGAARFLPCIGWSNVGRPRAATSAVSVGRGGGSAQSVSFAHFEVASPVFVFFVACLGVSSEGAVSTCSGIVGALYGIKGFSLAMSMSILPCALRLKQGVSMGRGAAGKSANPLARS